MSCFNNHFEVIIAIFTIILTIAMYYVWVFNFWKRKNIPSATLDYWNPITEAFAAWNKKIYDKFKSQGHDHGGAFLFTSPVYVPINPEYVKNILSKDFHHFVDRGVYYNEKDDPLSAHLFSIEGAKWRTLRAKLTPTFTSGKMKMMFQTFIDCSAQMKAAMEDLHSKQEPIDIKEVVACFTTDIIGSCAFGLDCNSFKNVNSGFRDHGKRLFKPTAIESLLILFGFANRPLARFLGICSTPHETAKFFMNVIQDTVNYRETNNIRRNDFMQLLIDLKNNVNDDILTSDNNHFTTKITMNELAAQAFVFFIAGFETSSTTMTFCLYELAMNPDIQQKVRNEIDAVLAKHDNNITYNATMDMKYMGQVIDETLRKYPPLPALNRICTETYKIPDSNITLEKGVSVVISTLGLHHDPDLYPEPENFDPERFDENNKKERHPFTYIPFGEGPRVCIGLRFGILQTKVGLTVLLKNYKFTLSKKTQLPIKMEPTSFILSVEGGMWLDVEKIS